MRRKPRGTRFFKISKRLVVVAVAIALWRGDVAILDIVILGGYRR
jgi:hypothetical protein